MFLCTIEISVSDKYISSKAIGRAFIIFVLFCYKQFTKEAANYLVLFKTTSNKVMRHFFLVNIFKQTNNLLINAVKRRAVKLNDKQQQNPHCTHRTFTKPRITKWSTERNFVDCSCYRIYPRSKVRRTLEKALKESCFFRTSTNNNIVERYFLLLWPFFKRKDYCVYIILFGLFIRITPTFCKRSIRKTSLQEKDKPCKKAVS